MGQTLNLINKKFGKLTVIKKTDMIKNGAIVWKCKCDCNGENSIVYETTGNLNSGRKKSCGCLTHQNKYEDLTNQIFGRLTVLYDTGKHSNNRCRIWHCICSCQDHNEIDVASDRLKNGNTKSCGCLQKEIAKEIGENTTLDLLGQKFGKLKVIKQLQTKNNRSMWLCECSCKECNQIIVSGWDLRRGHVNSCGCIKKSVGEYTIGKLLEDNKKTYKRNVHFDDCKFPDTNYYAYFDFYVDNKYIIEYDGEQHFRSTCFNGIKNFDAKGNFQKTQAHDIFKNNYCFNNNIPIIRIPYTHLSKLSFDDLSLETSKFILKG